MAKISSGFLRGTENWTIAGDVNRFEWRASGGKPGGYLYWEDAAAGADSYWQAPLKFLGDLRAFAGGKITYQWYSSGNDYATGDVLISGGNGTTIVADARDPGTGWTRAAIALNVNGGWHIGAIDGRLATNAEIRDVLRDVSQIQIRAEHVFGNESGGLDSFAITSRPAPASAFGDDTPALDHGLLRDAHADIAQFTAI